MLVVDDDPTVAEVVRLYLERAGYLVALADDGPAALATADAFAPDLVVLDLMLPGLDGIEVCRRLRASCSVPVLMLTARGSELDRIAGLEVGADDYVSKPFSPRELLLRVKSVLRRTSFAVGPALPELLTDGSLVVDTARHQATLDGRALALTSREYDLLVFLMRQPRQAFNRGALLERVWGWTYADAATVTVHVRRLREKIESDPAVPKRIVTVWGTGYRYEPGASP